MLWFSGADDLCLRRIIGRLDRRYGLGLQEWVISSFVEDDDGWRAASRAALKPVLAKSQLGFLCYVKIITQHQKSFGLGGMQELQAEP